MGDNISKNNMDVATAAFLLTAVVIVVVPFQVMLFLIMRWIASKVDSLVNLPPKIPVSIDTLLTLIDKRIKCDPDAAFWAAWVSKKISNQSNQPFANFVVETIDNMCNDARR